MKESIGGIKFITGTEIGLDFGFGFRMLALTSVGRTNI